MNVIGEVALFVYTWWVSDELPELAPLPNLHIKTTNDLHLITYLSDETESTIKTLIQSQNIPYVAFFNATPVAIGWSCVGETSFGKPPQKFRVPETDRYLRSFVTLPPWRGKGIYTHLLQTIIRQEQKTANRFWILSHYQNTSSQKGILKSGFQKVATIHKISEKGFILVGLTNKANEGAKLLNLPYIKIAV